ncbi:heterokaryon incompatibility [Fusarium longipes]|uniref:Heterokaryon incompatibility n=1 Tax=Fusarium longipes TaxID=694270 RepID=A0A395RWI7_9HYPO|nr:heterokaryon incompatibility [Fusarium longipes]
MVDSLRDSVVLNIEQRNSLHNLLCNSCKAIEINDVAHGGALHWKTNGKPYVDFGDVTGSMSSRFARGEGHMPSYLFSDTDDDDDDDDSLYTFPKNELSAEYHRVDKFPNLPNLLRGDSEGRSFCKLLRHDLLSAHVMIMGCLLAKSSGSSDSDSDGTESEISETERAKLLQESTQLNFTKVAYRLRETVDQDELESDTDGSEQGEDETNESCPKPKTWLDTLYVFFSCKRGNKQSDFSLHYNIHVDREDPCASFFNIWRSPFPKDLLRSQSLNRLNNLIEKSFRYLPVAKEAFYVPTRLLDVGTSEFPSLKVVLKNEVIDIEGQIEYDVRYMALSYCWGSKEQAAMQLKTTRDNLDNHRLQVNMENLPLTIADAVHFCRCLHIRYLWVDALCILQGDEEDWSRESLEMSNVYSKSYITLCVLRGSSCLDGFLKRHIEIQSPMKLRIRSGLDNSVEGTLYLQSLGSPHNLTCDDFTETGAIMLEIDQPMEFDTDENTWQSRGWTFQEAELSPRRLMVGDRMIHFSCAEMHESADGTHFTEEVIMADISKNSVPICSWYQLAENFSQRSLSFETDRLPALSGLARIMNEHHPQQTYLAGLWEADLHRGLLWTFNQYENFEKYQDSHHNPYIAPSWSWASRLSEVIYMWVDRAESNIYGRVSAGYLLLDARFQNLAAIDSIGYELRSGSEAERIWLGVVFHYILQSQDGKYIAHVHLDWAFHGPDDVKGKPNGPVRDLCIMLTSSTKSDQRLWPGPRSKEDPEAMLGIVLLSTNDSGEFEKVGLWFSESRELGGRKFWDKIEKSLIKIRETDWFCFQAIPELYS